MKKDAKKKAMPFEKKEAKGGKKAEKFENLKAKKKK